MSTADIDVAITRSIRDLRLLDHPYYRAWQQGLLTIEDLGAYACQYRHFEQVLPEVLASIAAQLPAGTEARRLVESNLSDETTNPRPHIEVFEQFAKAVDAQGAGDSGDRAEPSGSTQALVALYREAAEEGPVPALAVIAAYEVQAAAVATTKAIALADDYGIDSVGTEFWSVHADLEESHAAWTVEALEQLSADAETVREWAARSARGWWALLDDREAARAAKPNGALRARPSEVG